jgi:hypothetical protein
MAPCLLRFTRVASIEPSLVSDSVQSLIAKWIDDPTTTKAPPATPIEVKPEYYTSEFTLGELLEDPRTEALLNEYLPKIPRKGIVRVLTVEQLSQYFGGADNAAKLAGFSEALRKIPVQQE